MAILSAICVSSENIQFYSWVFVLKFSKERNLHHNYNSDFGGPKINYGYYDNFCPSISHNENVNVKKRRKKHIDVE